MEAPKAHRRYLQLKQTFYPQVEGQVAIEIYLYRTDVKDPADHDWKFFLKLLIDVPISHRRQPTKKNGIQVSFWFGTGELTWHALHLKR
jgi:predicted phosphoadenosine phosphosulfate sulfurtransferase